MKPSPKLDPCLTATEQVTQELKSLVIGEGNKLDGFLMKGEIDQATTFSRSVLMSLESASKQTGCGKALSQNTKALVCTLIHRAELVSAACTR